MPPDNIAVFPGTFDPITNGHIALIERAATLFSHLIVGIGENMQKQPLFESQARLQFAQAALSPFKNVSVKAFKGLVVDFAGAQGAKVIVRGIRSSTDFDYESQLAQYNRRLASKIETLFLVAEGQSAFISSSFVREVAHWGKDVSAFVPAEVALALKNRV